MPRYRLFAISLLLFSFACPAPIAPRGPYPERAESCENFPELCDLPLTDFGCGEVECDDNAYQIVFIGDGFRSDDFFDYRSLVETHIFNLRRPDGFVNFAPELFRFWRLDVDSNRTLVDNDDLYDTPLGAHLQESDLCSLPPEIRALESRFDFAYENAELRDSNAQKVPLSEVTFVLLSRQSNGRANATPGFNVRVSSNNSSDVVRHELGHALFYLEDEYAECPVCEEQNEADLLQWPNITSEESDQKWNGRVEGHQPGGGRLHCLNHPQSFCLMNQGVGGFCEVCEASIREHIAIRRCEDDRLQTRIAIADRALNEFGDAELFLFETFDERSDDENDFLETTLEGETLAKGAQAILPLSSGVEVIARDGARFQVTTSRSPRMEFAPTRRDQAHQSFWVRGEYTGHAKVAFDDVEVGTIFIEKASVEHTFALPEQGATFIRLQWVSLQGVKGDLIEFRIDAPAVERPAPPSPPLIKAPGFGNELSRYATSSKAFGANVFSESCSQLKEFGIIVDDEIHSRQVEGSQQGGCAERSNLLLADLAARENAKVTPFVIDVYGRLVHGKSVFINIEATPCSTVTDLGEKNTLGIIDAFEFTPPSGVLEQTFGAFTSTGDPIALQGAAASLGSSSLPILATGFCLRDNTIAFQSWPIDLELDITPPALVVNASRKSEGVDILSSGAVHIALYDGQGVLLEEGDANTRSFSQKGAYVVATDEVFNQTRRELREVAPFYGPFAPRGCQ